MIDRLLLELLHSDMPEGLFETLVARFGRLIELDREGELVWEKPRTAKYRSDDPNVNFKFSVKGIQIWGSPAMLEHGLNVFGSSDIRHCGELLIRNASKELGVILPPLEKWYLKGLDITQNYFLPSPSEVQTALTYLGRVSDGKLKTVRYPSTVYFGYGSQTRTGKIYAKGPHLDRLERRKVSIDLHPVDRNLCYHLIRFELSLKSVWLKRNLLKYCDRWFELSEADLSRIYNEFWGRLLGEEIELPSAESEIERAVIDAALDLGMTKGIGLGAYKTWTTIRSIGPTRAKEVTSKATWYRHLKVLKHAGFTMADIECGSVQPIRISVIRLGAPVESFEDLRERAKKAGVL